MKPKKDIQVSLIFLGVTLLLAFAAWWAWRQYMESPPYIDRERFPVMGIDVSAHNGMMNLDAAARDGVEFIWIKASEGTDFRDENFSINYDKATHAGLKVGAYHFFRFDRDGVDQAVNLLKTIGKRPLDLGVAIDVEDHGNPSGIPPEVVNDRLQRMVEVLNLRGYRVVFYSNRSGYEKYLMDNFRGFPLWICSFSDSNAAARDWSFWQYDHHGSVDGIRGDVDLNVFAGSREDWERHFRDRGPANPASDPEPRAPQTAP